MINYEYHTLSDASYFMFRKTEFHLSYSLYDEASSSEVSACCIKQHGTPETIMGTETPYIHN